MKVYVLLQLNLDEPLVLGVYDRFEDAADQIHGPTDWIRTPADGEVWATDTPNIEARIAAVELHERRRARV